MRTDATPQLNLPLDGFCCGPFVCGLHVHADMQVLHWRENTQKANVYWPNMWCHQESLL